MEKFELVSIGEEIATTRSAVIRSGGNLVGRLARERDKGGMVDISKAGHSLQGLVELLEVE